MPRILLAASFFVLSLSSLAIGQSTPGPRRVDPAEHRSIQSALEARDAGYQSFLRKAGGTWSVRYDESTGLASLIYGSGLKVGTGKIASLADAQSRAEAILAAFPELWHAPLKDLHLTSALQSGRIYAFTWEQRFDGLVVHRARVQIQIHEVGRVAAIVAETIAIPEGFARNASITAEEAQGVVRDGKAMLAADEVTAKDFVVYMKGLGGRAVPRSAYVVDVRQPSRKNFERVYVDANTKEILEVEPRIHDFTDVKGQVTAMVNTTNSGLGVPTQVPVAGISVNVAGVGTAVTDANGNYLISTGLAGPFNVSAGVSGPMYNVNSAQGGNLVFTNQPTTNQGGAEVKDLLFNNPAAQFGTSQVNAAYHVVVLRNWAQARIPFGGYANQMISVNETSTCNAFYDPNDNSIHFYAAGGSCSNTGFSNVIYHESGHGVDDYFGGITSGSVSEAIGDIFAMYISGSPIIGEGFYTSGAGIRTGENTTTWPASSCNGEVHCVGEVFMGFAWQARKKLITSLGSGPGAGVAEHDFITQIPINPTGTLNSTTQVFIQDDDNGDLSDGTPHYADLSAAATMKGLPSPTVLYIAITHDRHPDSWSQTQPYLIYAKLEPSGGNAITGATVDYTIEGGGSGSVAMSPTTVADEWMGAIPAQIGPKLISYSITATDTAAHVVTSPPAGTGVYRFNVGKHVTLFFDDMDSGNVNWSHGAISGTDDWQLGNPQTTGTNVYDPVDPFSGNNCWGNDLQLNNNQNGLYSSNSENWLDTPSINASGHTGVRLRYRRWLTINQAPNDQATLSVNGTQVFANPTTAQFIDTSWVLEDLATPSADNVASFKVRWRLKSNFSNNLGGWNVDDVEVYSLEATPVLNLQLTPNSTNPPTGQDLVFNFQGTPNATFGFLLSAGPGPTYADGYGVVPVQASTLTPILTANLDPTGNFVLPIPIPYAPVLSGFKIWWVSYAVAPGALPQISNTVVTTFQ